MKTVGLCFKLLTVGPLNLNKLHDVKEGLKTEDTQIREQASCVSKCTNLYSVRFPEV
jgi:hypothetical protein